MSSDTARAFTVRHRRVSPTAMGRCLPFFYEKRLRARHWRSKRQWWRCCLRPLSGLSCVGIAPLVPVAWEDPSLNVFWPDGPVAESCAKERRVFSDHGQPGSCRKGDQSNRKQLPQCCVLCSMWRMTVSHLLGDCFGVGSREFVEQGGAGLGELAFLRQDRGLVSSLNIARVVGRVCGVDVGLGQPFTFWIGRVRGVCHRESRAPSSQCSNIRCVSLEDCLQEGKEEPKGHRVEMECIGISPSCLLLGLGLSNLSTQQALGTRSTSTSLPARFVRRTIPSSSSSCSPQASLNKGCLASSVGAVVKDYRVPCEREPGSVWEQYLQETHVKRKSGRPRKTRAEKNLGRIRSLVEQLHVDPTTEEMIGTMQRSVHPATKGSRLSSG